MAPQQQKGRRYFIKTYGCQMNVADSDRLAQVLESFGYEPSDGFGLDARNDKRISEDDERNEPRNRGRIPDILLVNTCVVRQNAEDRAAWFVTSAKGLKEQNPNLKIVLCGCLVTEPGRDVHQMFSHVDLFLPPNSPEKLRHFINSPPLSPSLDKRGGDRAKRGGGEFVTITHGCNNFCSYCIVPYVRGREVSRPLDDVLAEVKSLVEQGATDITLLGQNVNSYQYGLAKLLRELPKAYRPIGLKDQDVRFSFMTSHPRDMTDEIIQAVKESPCVAKDFHLPLQSGDDRILQLMNRGYTTDHFRQMVQKIRGEIPAARVSSEVIVGFPSETEEEFNRTLDFVRAMNFTHVNMFAYSARPGTAAAQMTDQLPEEVKQARLQKLIALVRGSLKG